MRTKVAITILLVAGMASAAHLLIGDRTLSLPQLEKVRMVCPECHGDVPEYDHVSKVHQRHAANRCSFCHQDQIGLKTTENFRANLERVGLGTLFLTLLGIFINIVMIRRRDKVN